jgi:vacuolar protein sorting-associated protein 53
MLLDKYEMTKSFTTLITLHHPASSAAAGTTPPAPSTPPAGFTRRVGQAMGRVDPLLKTLQVRPSPPEGLVQAYLIHIGDRSDVNFRKILELKGVRKQDAPHLLELFAIHRESFAGGRELVQSSPLLTPLMQAGALGSAVGAGGGGGGGGGGGAGLGIAGMPGLPAKFDAVGLGERLLNVARDGVDRLGTTAVAGPASPAPGAVGAQGAAGEKATVSDNLKNIGKFFRRDMGGFGARFGKRDITPTGGEER